MKLFETIWSCKAVRACLLTVFLAGVAPAATFATYALAASANVPEQGARIGKSGLPLPRYVSLAKARVNLRKGPGLRYPIDWVYKRSDLPVEIIAEFDTWRQIRDWEGTVGWVHGNMLQGKRSIMITERTRTLRQNPLEDAPALLHAEAGVVGRLIECASGWCRVEIAGTRGWLKSHDFFGAYPEEVVK
jgi:SH3-like domain-containing protein